MPPVKTVRETLPEVPVVAKNAPLASEACIRKFRITVSMLPLHVNELPLIQLRACIRGV
jgi:hypothetical protein